MIDHLEARAWADHRSHVANALVAILTDAYDALAALTAIRYRAPWTNPDRAR